VTTDDVESYVRLLARARARSATGEWTEAARLWAAVVERNPDHGELWWRLGEARERSGDRAGAIGAYTRAQELGRGHPAESAYAVARCHALTGDAELALEWLERALALGYRHVEQAREDADLASLRDDPRFRRLLGLIDRDTMTRDDGWRADLRYLAAEVRRRRHPMRAEPAAALETAAADLAARVADLTDDQLVAEITRLAAGLGDGHSGAWSEDERHRGWLPLKLFWFEEGMHVIATHPAHRELLGARVLRMGDRTVEDLAGALLAVVGRDHDRWPREVIPGRLRQLRLLHTMGLIPDPERATLTVADLEGRERPVTVDARLALPGPWGEGRLPCPDGWVFLPDTLATPLPLTLRNVGASYWFAHLPEHRLVYAQLNLVLDDPAEPLQDFARRLLVLADGGASDVERLVLDVRWCPGGNTFLLMPLIHRIAGSAKLGARGGLFVIIGRRTSSAAQNLVTMLDRHARPIFVGEPTGSSPNFVGETVPFALPYSGVRVNVSDLYWQSSWPMDHRPWIAPDIPAPPTFAAFRRNVDPAMDAILACDEHLPGW
jgi:tetratricopeptide (TPR) repeat protein